MRGKPEKYKSGLILTSVFGGLHSDVSPGTASLLQAQNPRYFFLFKSLSTFNGFLLSEMLKGSLQSHCSLHTLKHPFSCLPVIAAKLHSFIPITDTHAIYSSTCIPTVETRSSSSTRATRGLIEEVVHLVCGQGHILQEIISTSKRKC